MDSDVINKLIGHKISSLRRQMGLSQQKLADNLNIARTSVGNIEKGRHQTSIPILYKIAIFFDVKVESLLPSIDEVLNPELDIDLIFKKALEEHPEQIRNIILDLKRK